MAGQAEEERRIGLMGATGVGIGAIVGGGILALAGVGYAVTGPGVLAAFALNGVIAVLSALSFAEMSTAFPESGGSYVFAKKVASIQTAFVVGWVVWFASIVAAVLYSLGFAAFGVILLQSLWTAMVGTDPAWLATSSVTLGLALGATVLFAGGLALRNTAGGQWINIAKVLVFGVLILGGIPALAALGPETAASRLTPFLPDGIGGLARAMGYTFIALQGFDLIAALAGEVKEPRRTLPRAMLFSLAAALCIYLPLLLVVAVAGVGPGESIRELSLADPETVLARAAGRYLGATGFWLVIVAAVLSMLSALQANLLAASRIALTMARDRTLPAIFDAVHPTRRTPVVAIGVSTVAVGAVAMLLPDVGAAGAAASLIFLLSFAMTHMTAILARVRGGGRAGAFRVRFFPLVPLLGGLGCLGLALFQGIAVPEAGRIALVWVAVGAVLFLSLFARRARIVDASAQARDPELSRLRGRQPLVLVPIANPQNAGPLVFLADALAPPKLGRIQLMSVVAVPKEIRPEAPPQQLLYAQQVLGESLMAALVSGRPAEALITVAPTPWPEIQRVAGAHRCETLLLGFSKLPSQVVGGELDRLMSSVDCHVVVLRAPPGWHPSSARRILVPVGGRGNQFELRARLLGDLQRTGAREIRYLLVVDPNTSEEKRQRAQRVLRLQSRDEAPEGAEVEVAVGSDPAGEIVRRAAEHDLVILGLRRLGRRQKVMGEITMQIAAHCDRPLLLISSRG